MNKYSYGIALFNTPGQTPLSCSDLQYLNSYGGNGYQGRGKGVTTMEWGYTVCSCYFTKAPNWDYVLDMPGLKISDQYKGMYDKSNEDLPTYMTIIGYKDGLPLIVTQNMLGIFKAHEDKHKADFEAVFTRTVTPMLNIAAGYVGEANAHTYSGTPFSKSGCQKELLGIIGWDKALKDFETERVKVNNEEDEYVKSHIEFPEVDSGKAIQVIWTGGNSYR